MSDLIVIEDINAVELFTGTGLSDVIARIRGEVMGPILDINKKKDRDLMRTNAANISKAKVKLDNLGKELTEDWKKKSKAVDNSRKQMREEMDALRNEVREPLTVYEDAEKARKAHLEATFDFIVSLSKAVNPETELHYTLEELEANLTGLANIVVDESLKEMELACIKAKQKSHDKLVGLIQDATEAAAKQVEFERLQKESAEREQIERDARIATEAADEARVKAELEASKQQQESEAREAKAKQAEADAVQATIDAEASAKLAAEQAEARAIDAKEQAEKARILQAEQAELNKQAAVNAEIARQQAEQKRELDALAVREANKANCKKVNNAAMQCFINGGLSEESAKLAVTLIAKKSIKNVQINY